MSMKHQIETLANIARSAWRFRWIALALSTILAIAGTFVVLVLPGYYESRAQIYVDTKSVLKPLLQGLAVSTEQRDETDVVRNALLARPFLDQVARKTGLFTPKMAPQVQEEVLTDLADQITIKGDSSVGLYTIAYADSSARTAQAVVQNLLDTFVNGSITTGRADSQNAQQFLADQVKEYERRLSESEQQLADFKKRNIGLMPDQRGDYFVRLQAELSNLAKLKSDLAVATQQRDELRRKLSSDVQGSKALAAPPTNQQIQAAVTLDARIRDSRQQLDDLLLKYTDRHPEVIALKDTIKRLEDLRQAELGGVRPTNAAPTASPGAVPTDPVIQNLQIALNNADIQLAALSTQVRQSEAQIGELQRMVTTGPEIEAELARMNRDYGVTKAQYEALLQRLESARLSNDADRREELRFKVLEPPTSPLQAVRPNRPLFLSAVIVASLLMGVGLALLLSLLQPVFYSKSSVGSTLNLPVIGVVSRAYSQEERAHQVRAVLAYGSAIAVLVAAVVLAAVFSYSASLFLRNTFGLGDG
jgi:polysaccharide chain length determinant protein (PEP-CTERM system associated)